jgi:hypothetical protein
MAMVMAIRAELRRQRLFGEGQATVMVRGPVGAPLDMHRRILVEQTSSFPGDLPVYASLHAFALGAACLQRSPTRRIIRTGRVTEHPERQKSRLCGAACAACCCVLIIGCGGKI